MKIISVAMAAKMVVVFAIICAAIVLVNAGAITDFVSAFWN